MTGPSQNPGAHLLAIFRVAGTVKHFFGGLISGLTTTGIFSWLRPAA